MKIQPIDCEPTESSVKPVVKSRFKKLFEWQFSSVLKTSTTDLEPISSVCLANLVQNFIEENNEKQQTVKCNNNHRCNCFNGNCSDSSDDDDDDEDDDDLFNSSTASFTQTCDLLKSLVCCESNLEKNVLTETVKIVEKNNKICNCKRKEECRQVVIDGLVSLGYNACICKSKWEKSSSFPSGEYEYIDVMIEGGDRLILDIDFKSEFEIARSTGNYRCLLQSIPAIYVGKIDRLKEIVTIVSDAAKKSLLKKGMHVPPWRKTEYMIAKWISPYTRTSDGIESVPNKSCLIETKNFSGEFELKFSETCSNSIAVPVEEEKISVVVTPWKPPAIKPKSNQKGTKMVAGLASVLKEKP